MFIINGKMNDEYGCVHTHTIIASPEAKWSVGTVPLADGNVDLTALLSPVTFYNVREIQIQMELMKIRADWPLYYQTILADLHGQKVRLELDNDPIYYWTGYATVDALEDHGATAGITIHIEANPFKRTKDTDEIHNAAVSGDVTLSVKVEDLRGYLTFTTSAASVTVTYDGQTWTLPAGESTAYGLVLPHGTNTVTLHGAGQTVKVEKEEGTL